MGVEAARLALRSAPGAAPEAIWFATATPAYLDKTNATAIHSALRQPSHVAAFDFGGALRSGSGALRSSLGAAGTGTTLVVLADLRDGLPTSADESAGGDGAAAVVVGDDAPGTPVIAEYLGGASVSDEFLDRWRTAGRPAVQGVGGAVRGDPLRPAGRRGLGVGPQGGRADRRPGRPGGGHRHARPGGQGPDPQARRAATARWPTTWARRWDRPGPPTPGWCWPPCSSRPGPARWWPWWRWPTGPTSCCSGPPRPWSSWTPAEPVADQIAAGADLELRQVPVLAGHGHHRAAPPPRAPAGLGLGGVAQRGVEVRVRGLPRPHLARPCTSRRPGSR